MSLVTKLIVGLIGAVTVVGAIVLSIGVPVVVIVLVLRWMGVL